MYTDSPSGTQNSDISHFEHCSFLYIADAGLASLCITNPDCVIQGETNKETRQWQTRSQAIDPVLDAAIAWQQTATILDSYMPLDQGLKKIAHNTKDCNSP